MTQNMIRSVRLRQAISRAFHLALALSFFIGLSSAVKAQLFGSGRQLGSPIQRRQQPGIAGQPTTEAGNVQGNERFLRTNRRRGDFVGSDRFERRSFIGAQQGSSRGAAMNSTVGVRPDRDRSRQLNRAVERAGRNEAYAPVLQLGFATAVSPGIRFGDHLKRELENPKHFSSANRFEVLVEGRTAILRGVVADEVQRDLAELLVSFEPGISEVRNQLVTDAKMPKRGYSPPYSDETVPPTPVPSAR